MFVSVSTKTFVLLSTLECEISVLFCFVFEWIPDPATVLQIHCNCYFFYYLNLSLANYVLQ